MADLEIRKPAPETPRSDRCPTTRPLQGTSAVSLPATVEQNAAPSPLPLLPLSVRLQDGRETLAETDRDDASVFYLPPLPQKPVITSRYFDLLLTVVIAYKPQRRHSSGGVRVCSRSRQKPLDRV